jgi:tripartite-type tricarboxylate transporter receptor subunit TctC
MSLHRCLKLLAACLAFAAAGAVAQVPGKPIRIVVPFSAGGQIDSATRMIADALTQSLGQPVVVEARAGADGQIAATEVLRAAPDGHTLFLGAGTPLSMVPVVRTPPPYDPVTDFTPISFVGTAVFFVMTHPDLPVTSLQQLVAHARANPGKLAFGSSSGFTLAATSFFMHQEKLQMLHVPYKGEAPALPDFLAGRVQLMFATPSLGLSHVREGKLRALAVLTPRRSSQLPEVPTMAELGYQDVPVTSWVAFFGPANLPVEIVGRLNREINAILARPAVREDGDRRGLILRGSSPAELGEHVRMQLELWRRIQREGWIPKS